MILIRVIFIATLLLFTLNARENPFFPSVGEKDILVTSNESRTKTRLKRAAITLPTQARIVQKVTIEFKNLDGSLQSKSIELDNSVDWHLPIFISQSYSQTSKVQNFNSTSKSIIEQKKSKYKNLASLKQLSLFSSGKSLKLITTDKMLRNFLLVNPHRIVLDFKKSMDIKYYSKKNKKSIFKKIRIGDHKGYYRVVIELDGYYRYELKKLSKGYIIELI